MKTTIARWESKTGKHFVDLYKDDFGYSYQSPGAIGNLGALASDGDAISILDVRVASGYFLPDNAKTPMRRVI